jgi:hypothetical protein
MAVLSQDKLPNKLVDYEPDAAVLEKALEGVPIVRW